MIKKIYERFEKYDEIVQNYLYNIQIEYLWVKCYGFIYKLWQLDNHYSVTLILVKIRLNNRTKTIIIISTIISKELMFVNRL